MKRQPKARRCLRRKAEYYVTGDVVLIGETYEIVTVAPKAWGR